MTTTRATPRVHYLNVNHGIKSWLFTTDHKRIALLYLTSITLFFFLGGAAAVVMRLELLTPPGDLVLSETYNKLFTIHGIVMIFFFLLGPLNTIIALTIAAAKALFVLLFFMHLRYSSGLIWIVWGAGIFWLMLLLTITLSDYLTRNWVPVASW
jgi:cytochrome c oxidase subunit 1